MRKRYYVYRRGQTYYAEDSETKHRESLHTGDRGEAERLIHAKNEAAGQPHLGLALGRAYLSAYDPKLLQRTWSLVIDEFCRRGKAQTQARRNRASASKVFDPIRNRRILETTADDLRAILASSGAFTNLFLRCVHNLALGLGWLPWPIISSKLWPVVRPKPKRGITREEHQTIVTWEGNKERRLFYEMLWEIGASQTDAANLMSSNVDWENGILRYQRRKTGEWATIRIGPRLQALLERMPLDGPLFPHLSKLADSARSAEFYRRCKLSGIRGVSLHCYRYAWAERAKAAGYPERWAQNALGHNSRAVHQAYAKGGSSPVCPSLEEYEEKAVQLRRSSRRPALLPITELALGLTQTIDPTRQKSAK